MERKIVYLVILVLLYITCGCATVNEKNEESLRTVAEEYWKLRIEGNFDKSYKLEYKKDLLSFEDYKNIAVGILKASVKKFRLNEIRIEGENALIDVEFYFLLPGVSKLSKDILTDKWIYKNGKWWHILPK